MFLITTSHRASQRTRSFIKDLTQLLPYSVHITRGKKTLDELVLEAYRRNLHYILVVGEKHGNPSVIWIYKAEWVPRPFPPRLIMTIKILGVKLSRENPNATRTYGVKTINVSVEKCIRDDCYFLGDLLLSVYNEHISENPDLRIILEDREGYTLLKGLNKLNRVTGPIIRILRVRKI